ncbi:MAG: GNAT family N-acetyltransferase [Acidobacteria bacterium]|nr:GNAT family N-acetyltransferase [Acidobacteriota bacterium]
MEAILRSSGPQDLETHVAHRAAMFRDMDMGDEEGIRRMAGAFRERLRTWMALGEAHGWIAELGGRPVGGALLFLKESLPVPHLPVNVRGYLANVYVEPPCRGQGLARRLAEAAIACSREHGLPVLELHASLASEPLFQSLGFMPTSEYRLVLDPGVAVPRQWRDRR